jgi:myosin-6
MKVKQLRSHLTQLQELSKKLKSNSDKQNCEQTIKKCDSRMNELLRKLKTDNNLKTQDIDREINEFNKLINENVTLLKGKLAEQQRLQQIQEQMEKERKLKEEEEKKLKESEEIKRRKAEIEERHRLEAIARAEREAKELKAEQERQNREEIEREAEMFRLEQERRDHELASRLAQDSQSSVSDDWQSSPTMLPRSAAVINFFQIIFKIIFFLIKILTKVFELFF